MAGVDPRGRQSAAREIVITTTSDPSMPQISAVMNWEPARPSLTATSPITVVEQPQDRARFGAASLARNGN